MEKNYEAPAIVELGTVAELTLNTNVGTFYDSGVRSGQPVGTSLS